MPKHNEYIACVELVKWWGYAHKSLGTPEFLLVHVPNQAGGNPRTGQHLKRMGVRAGFSDYLLLVPNAQGFHGLCLEMKTQSGVVSPAQKAMATTLTAQGYKCVVCRGCGEARDVIEKYIKGAL